MEHLGELLALVLDQFLYATLSDDGVDSFKVYTSEKERFPTVDAVVVRLLWLFLRCVVRHLVSAGFDCAFDDGDVLTTKLADLFPSQLLGGWLGLYRLRRDLWNTG